MVAFPHMNNLREAQNIWRWANSIKYQQTNSKLDIVAPMRAEFSKKSIEVSFE